ncbi:hypothetical protein CCZ01_09990, partial [Helicobacter monodelphidis]
FAEWKSITGSKDFGPAYIVKKNKATSSLGNSFSYYTYEVGMVDLKKETLYRSGPSSMLNRNMVIIELRDAYKTSLEWDTSR